MICLEQTPGGACEQPTTTYNIRATTWTVYLIPHTDSSVLDLLLLFHCRGLQLVSQSQSIQHVGDIFTVKLPALLLLRTLTQIRSSGESTSYTPLRLASDLHNRDRTPPVYAVQWSIKGPLRSKSLQLVSPAEGMAGKAERASYCLIYSNSGNYQFAQFI